MERSEQERTGKAGVERLEGNGRDSRGLKRTGRAWKGWKGQERIALDGKGLER